MSTPMFEQYRALKGQVPDAILLFRMGDFFELFFDDAVLASRVLDLTLTTRNRNDPEPIPMAGVPQHSVAGYIQRLVDAGHRVAIADQTEDPALAKGLVRREIVRVVTPGVTFDPTALDARRNNWLVAVARDAHGYGLAFLDASTGALRTTVAAQLQVVRRELGRMEPKELIAGPGVDAAWLAAELDDVTVSPFAHASWTAQEAPGEPSSARRSATDAALAYVSQHLGRPLSNLQAPVPYEVNAFLVIDAESRRNLELVRTVADGSRAGSLLALLDLAGTSMGSRRIGEWLASPLLEAPRIRDRQSCVAALVEDGPTRLDVRGRLEKVSDIERIVARLAQGRATPRDLVALGRSLGAVPALLQAASGLPGLPRSIDACVDLAVDLETSLVDDPPLSAAEGGLIRSGVDATLDELVRLSVDGVSVIDQLEARERVDTGISSLKIRHNRVFGYTIEVTTANLHRVPDRFLRKQTLANCERYVTSELQEIEARVIGAEHRRKSLELALFDALCDRVERAAVRLIALADHLATLDAIAALAEVASRRSWVRPEVDDSLTLDIVGGRHPVVEAALKDERFVPNDLRLDPEQRSLVLLTGPNMAGKSTVLRQVAILVLLAQMGSFVPADSARIGVCDRIFTRVGASDDLRRGRSTFMVEMSETASILNHATARSLVVLDEIGRGTSTYDGIAIAWAVAEDLHDRIRCRALFATHYHELCALADTHPRAANLSVAVSISGDQIVFLRRLKEGGASRSYGIQCARLAGLPTPVVERARALLTSFEKAAPEPTPQLGLFGARPVAVDPTPSDALRDALANLDPDALSPREAHALLYQLRGLV